MIKRLLLLTCVCLLAASAVQAQALGQSRLRNDVLSSPWLRGDFGDGSNVSGRSVNVTTTFTLFGSGTMYGTSDGGFHYVYQPMSDDIDAVVNVTGCTIPNPPGGGEQCGILVRSSLTASASNFACLLQTNAPFIRFDQWRVNDGEATNSDGYAASGHNWLKVQKRGTQFSCWESVNGTTWTQIGVDQTVTMGATFYAGMVANSNDSTVLVTGTFTNISFQTAVTVPTPDTDTLYIDRTNPLWWDNDAESDTFALVYIAAEVSNGNLNLIGMSRSPNPFAMMADPGEFTDIIQAAIDAHWHVDSSLLTHISTDLSSNYMTALSVPGGCDTSINGGLSCIPSTTPISSAGAIAMKNAVLATGTHAKPVVIGAGGPLTTVASAYLLAIADGREAEFVDKAVVIANNFYTPQYPVAQDYNSQQDEWSIFITLNKLRHVIVAFEPSTQTVDMTLADNFWNHLAASPSDEMGDQIRHIQNVTWPYDHSAVLGDMLTVLPILYPTIGSVFTNTITKVSATNVWGNWPPGYPDHGANMLNTNAYEKVLSIQTDALSDDRYITGIDASFALTAVQNAIDTAFLNHVDDTSGEESGGYRPTFTGHGFDSLGGRGSGSSSNICHVVNLLDTGGSPTFINALVGGGSTYNGTWRQCALLAAPRFVVFDVCGTIQMTGPIIFSSPYMTVAGQTACGQGITFKLYAGGDNAQLWYINTHDIVFQHVRIRAGANNPSNIPGGEDSIRMGGVTSPTGTADHIVYDHVTMSWSTHLMAWGDQQSASNMAFYDSMFYEGLTTIDANQTMSMLFYKNSICTVTVQRSIFSHNAVRNPLAGNGCKISFFNNIINDFGSFGETGGQYAANFWGSYATCDDMDPCPDATGPNVGPFEAVWVGNTYLWGPSSGSDARPIKQKFGSKAFPSSSATPTRVWLDDNADFKQNRALVGYFTDNTQTGQWNAVEVCSGSGCGGGYVNGVSTNAAVDNTGCTLAGGFGIRETNPACISWYTGFGFNIMARSTAYTYVLSHAGAFPLNRDYQDARTVTEVTNGTGSQISNKTQSQSVKANLSFTTSDGYPILTTSTSTYSNPTNPWSAGSCGSASGRGARWNIECALLTDAISKEP